MDPLSTSPNISQTPPTSKAGREEIENLWVS